MRRHPTQPVRTRWFWVGVALAAVLPVTAWCVTQTAAGAVAAAQAEILSPCEGFFYASEYPGDIPLVQVGTHVEPEMIVCYIQTMEEKVAVPAGVRGTVVEVLVVDMEVVGMNQPLFRVIPHP